MHKGWKLKPFIEIKKAHNISFIFSDDFIVPIPTSKLDTDLKLSVDLEAKFSSMKLLYHPDERLRVSITSNSQMISEKMISFIKSQSTEDGSSKYKFVNHSTGEEESDVVVFIPDSLFSIETRNIFRDLIQRQKKVLLLDFNRKHIHLGPLYTGDSADSTQFDSYVERRFLNSTNATLMERNFVPVTKLNDANILAAISFLQNRLEFTDFIKQLDNSTLLEFDLSTLTFKELKVPPFCFHQPAHQNFKASPNDIVESGSGFRVRRVEETFNHLIKYVCPTLGLLSRIVTYDSEVDFSSVGIGFIDLASRGTIASNYGSSGKGISKCHSMVSTIAEAIERSCLFFPIDFDEVIFAKASDLKLNHRILNPNAIEEIHDWQRAEKKLGNPYLDMFDLCYSYKDEAIHWSNAYSLVHGYNMLIPSKACYNSNQFPREHYFVETNSNGMAAGSTIEEAIIQGSLEIIERDAFSIWWFNELRLPEVVGVSEKSEFIRKLQVRLLEQGIHSYLLYFKTDFEVHNFFAIGFNENGSNGIVAMGTHFNKIVAAERALGELAQSLPKSNHSSYCHFSFLNKKTHSFLQPLGHIHIDEIQEVKNDFNNTAEVITQLAGDFKSLGLDLIFSDVSNKLFNFKVVKVLAPGTAKHYQRLRCQRLYDVPEKLGLAQKKQHPSEFNKCSYINWKTHFYGT